MDKFGYWPSYIYGKIRMVAQPFYNTTYDVNKIIDGLYIGDFASACNREELIHCGITHIITAIRGVDEIYPDDFKYKLLDIGDSSTNNIKQHFEECNEFIENAINSGGNVLIHCMYGISRSATIACAYLIYKYKMIPLMAINTVKSCRYMIKPNSGFVEQLNKYYNELHT